MKIQFDLTSLQPCDALQQLAGMLDARVENDTILIPASQGDGMIQKSDIAKGFSILSFDMRLHHAGEFRKTAAVHDNEIFNLLYIITPQSFTHSSAEGTATQNGQVKVLFDTVDREHCFSFLSGERIQFIMVSMEAGWLKKEFENSKVTFRCLLNHLIHDVHPALHYRTVNPEEYKAVRELQAHFRQDNREPFFMKAKAMLLMSGFFNTIFIDNSREPNDAGLYHNKMNAVLNLLRDHVHQQLPSLGDIARSVALSESSLKRYFKTVYGTSVYEFYLQMKMQKAKEMLGLARVPVKEVAYNLGYECTSSFIRVFKKFHQLSPGFFHKMQLQ